MQGNPAVSVVYGYVDDIMRTSNVLAEFHMMHGVLELNRRVYELRGRKPVMVEQVMVIIYRITDIKLLKCQNEEIMYNLLVYVLKAIDLRTSLLYLCSTKVIASVYNYLYFWNVVL